MYEHLTFDVILQRMLENVPANIDKRQGSVIYDACAPAAAELAQMYIELDIHLTLAFGTTASGQYLDLRTADYGVIRQVAAASHRKGLFYGDNNSLMDVPIGSRFSAEDTDYIVRERINTGEFVLECESAGSIGNQYFGSLLPIDYIKGLVAAEVSDILIPGEDVETDDSLRSRYLHRVRTPSSGGNVADYRDWAMNVAGVGGVKVYPLWDGNGTVKVVIVDSQKEPASEILVQETSDYIEHVRPIGSKVTVVSARAEPIHVTAKVNLVGGYSLQNVTNDVTNALIQHMRNLAFEANYVSIAQIGVILLSIPGVADYSELLLNGAATNFVLSEEAIPTLGTLLLEV